MIVVESPNQERVQPVPSIDDDAVSMLTLVEAAPYPKSLPYLTCLSLILSLGATACALGQGRRLFSSRHPGSLVTCLAAAVGLPFHAAAFLLIHRRRQNSSLARPSFSAARAVAYSALLATMWGIAASLSGWGIVARRQYGLRWCRFAADPAMCEQSVLMHHRPQALAIAAVALCAGELAALAAISVVCFIHGRAAHRGGPPCEELVLVIPQESVKAQMSNMRESM